MTSSEAISSTQGWWVVAATWALCCAVVGILYSQLRQWSRKANVKRRLLVKEDGRLMWRTVRGKCLVGSPGSKGEVSGRWSSQDKDCQDWAVIQVAKGKFVVYRFNKRVDDEPQSGVIQVCDSWRELEAAVPADIFESALLQAGFKKPSRYPEVPLKL
jgi:hypothetical protein